MLHRPPVRLNRKSLGPEVLRPIDSAAAYWGPALVNLRLVLACRSFDRPPTRLDLERDVDFKVMV